MRGRGRARQPGWWYKPDFIINELNINSAIALPSHDQVVPLVGPPTFKFEGYAYSGAQPPQPRTLPFSSPVLHMRQGLACV